MHPIRLLALAPLLLSFSANAERREFTYGVTAEIDSNGAVVSADLKAADVDTAFADAIEGLVKQWRFRPATVNGRPVSAHTLLTTQVVVDIDAGKSAHVVARYLRHGPEVENRLVPPRYPVEAMRSRVDAEVAVEVAIDRDGNLVETTLHSLRMKGGDKRLGRVFEQATIDAIRQWQFAPERINGIAVASRAIMPIKFTVRPSNSRNWKWIVEPKSDIPQVIDFNAKLPIAQGNATGLELISDNSKS